jgi:hypothetical protein
MDSHHYSTGKNEGKGSGKFIVEHSVGGKTMVPLDKVTMTMLDELAKKARKDKKKYLAELIHKTYLHK